MVRFRSFTILCLLSLILIPKSRSQSYVGGNIDSNTTWDIHGSPYELTADVIIIHNARLFIEPGVEVNFYGHSIQAGIYENDETGYLYTDSVRFNYNSGFSSIGFNRGSGSITNSELIGVMVYMTELIHDNTRLINNKISDVTWPIVISPSCAPMISNNLLTNCDYPFITLDGPLTRNNTLRKFDLDYQIMKYYKNNVLIIADGNTLKIETGVIIDLNGKSIQVGDTLPGKLIANDVNFKNLPTNVNSLPPILVKDGGGIDLVNCDFDCVFAKFESTAAEGSTLANNHFSNIDLPIVFCPNTGKQNIYNNSFTNVIDEKIGLIYPQGFIQTDDTIFSYSLDYSVFELGADNGATLFIEPGTRLDLTNGFIIMDHNSTIRASNATFYCTSGNPHWISLENFSAAVFDSCIFDCVGIESGWNGIGLTTVANSNFINEAYVYNDPGFQIILAENNWWGEISGPSDGTVPGKPWVYGAVDYDPWLSSPVDLLDEAPVITVQPVSKEVESNENAGFYLEAEGSNLTYRWMKNGKMVIDDGENITGANTNNLVISNASVFNGGNYNCIVSGYGGETVSDTACLKVTAKIDYKWDEDGWSFFNEMYYMWPHDYWVDIDYSPPEYPTWWESLSVRNQDYPEWKTFVEAFGEEHCYHFPNSLRIHSIGAFLYWRMLVLNNHVYDDNEHLVDVFAGACLGFSATSLLFYDNHLSIDQYFPGNNSLYEVEISEASRNLINKFQQYQHARNFKNYLGTVKDYTPNQTLEILLNSFSGSGSHRAILFDNCVTENGKSIRKGQHVVVPYKIENLPAEGETLKIYVYDPNKTYLAPEQLYFELNLETEEWEYPPLGWSGKGSGMLPAPPSDFFTEPSGGWKASTNLVQTEDSLDMWEIFPGTNHDIKIMNSNYEVLGYDNGEIYEEMSNAFPLFIYGPYNISQYPGEYYLPPDNYTIVMDDFYDTSYVFCNFTDSLIYSIRRKNTLANESDVFLIDDYVHPSKTTVSKTVNSKRSSVIQSQAEYSPDSGSFQNKGVSIVNSDIVSKIYSYENVVRSSAGEQYFAIENIEIGQSDTILFVNYESEGLLIKNNGQSSNYDLHLRSVSQSGEAYCSITDLSIKSNTSHLILPGWDALNDNDVTILSDGNNDGVFEEELLVNVDKTLKEYHDLSISPNPVSDYLFIESDRMLDSPFTITILDLGGRIWLKKRYSDSTELINGIHVSHLPPGFYIIELKNEKVFRGKVLIL